MMGVIKMQTRKITLDIINGLNDADFQKVTDFVRTLVHARSQQTGLNDAEMADALSFIDKNYSTTMEILAK